MYHYKISRIERVIDGDTIDVIIDLGFNVRIKERCRLADIDAPEVRTTDQFEKRLGFDAKEFVETWCSSGELTITTHKTGKYGRPVARFYKGDECLNVLLVENGYAWTYKFKKSHELLLKRRGFKNWQQYNDHYLLPETDDHTEATRK